MGGWREERSREIKRSGEKKKAQLAENESIEMSPEELL